MTSRRQVDIHRKVRSQCAGSSTCVALMMVLAFKAVASAQQPPTEFIKQHCIRCHGPETQEADLRLDTLNTDFGDSSAAGTWVEVLDRINLGEMPPSDEPQPTPAELTPTVMWITGELEAMRRRSVSTGGRVLLRRLTRTEYTNTIRDLLGVEFPEGEGPLEILPPDGEIGGFNKVSKGLLLDPSLLEKYLVAAELIADQAVRTRPPLVPTRKMHFDFADFESYQTSERGMDRVEGGVMVYTGAPRPNEGLRHPFNEKSTPITGTYIIRVRAGADRGERGEPIYMDLTNGQQGRLARFRVDAPIDEPQVYEFNGILDAQLAGEIQVAFVNGTRSFHGRPPSVVSALGNIDENDTAAQRKRLRALARDRLEGFGDMPNPELLNKATAPKLFLDYIEIEGPIHGPWPPRSMSLVFYDGLREDNRTVAYARQIFTRLLSRAYRRAATSTELDTIVGLVENEMERGLEFEEAIKVGIIGMLCSPKFLYLFEPSSDAGGSSQTAARDFKDKRGRTVRGRVISVEGEALLFERATDRRQFRLPINMFADADQQYIRGLTTPTTGLRSLSQFELATRLSYFLWSSMPDDELFRAAAAGQLTTPQSLAAQVDRMLADPKAESLVDDFAHQWLRIDEFDQFTPDREIFPAYYANEVAGIDDDMRTQPLAMFREILRKDESVANLLDSDWTMLNERLAAFYGIDNVEGRDFQRVAITPREEWVDHLRQVARNTPTIGLLHVVGPFVHDDFNAANEAAHPPEASVDLTAEYDGGLKWEQQPDWTDGEKHSLDSRSSANYVYRTINSPVAQPFKFSFGVDDALKVWLNGEGILQLRSFGGVIEDHRVIEVELREGENQLLMKVVNGNGGGGFYFRPVTLSRAALTALDAPADQRTRAGRLEISRLFLSGDPTASRGGLLGMAGVHKWGSDGNRTKPVERGKYILDVLFNDPPPPPPPNAGEVQPNEGGQRLTVRERLEKHRTVAVCANCHRRVDPYGLAMENFNVIGQWRDQEDGETPARYLANIRRNPIETTGTLPNGHEYQSYDEFKAGIVAQSDRFLRGLSEKMFVYALGRTIDPADRNRIDGFVQAMKNDGQTVRSLVKAIVASDAFRTK